MGHGYTLGGLDQSTIESQWSLMMYLAAVLGFSLSELSVSRRNNPLQYIAPSAGQLIIHFIRAAFRPRTIGNGKSNTSLRATLQSKLSIIEHIFRVCQSSLLLNQTKKILKGDGWGFVLRQGAKKLESMSSRLYINDLSSCT